MENNFKINIHQFQRTATEVKTSCNKVDGDRANFLLNLEIFFVGQNTEACCSTFLISLGNFHLYQVIFDKLRQHNTVNGRTEN